jgi:hypothetical protein
MLLIHDVIVQAMKKTTAKSEGQSHPREIESRIRPLHNVNKIRTIKRPHSIVLCARWKKYHLLSLSY